MTRRLLLDEMYPPLLADMLRDKGDDVRAAAASAELVGANDATVLDAKLAAALHDMITSGTLPQQGETRWLG